jgi:hypothetical protein
VADPGPSPASQCPTYDGALIGIGQGAGRVWRIRGGTGRTAGIMRFGIEIEPYACGFWAQVESVAALDQGIP